MDDIRTYLVNLPTRVPGLASVDENGDPMIYLNARLTIEQHRKTVDHELQHIQHDDFYNDVPIAQAERIASGQTAPAKTGKATKATKRPKQKLPRTPRYKDPLKTFYKAIIRIRDSKPEEERDFWDYLAEVFSRPPKTQEETQLRGFFMYGLEPDDPQWQRIYWASLHRQGVPDFSNLDQNGKPTWKPYPPAAQKMLRALFD